MIWNPVVSGAITFGVEVSDTPPSQTAATFLIATGFVEVGPPWQAINATFLVANPVRDILVRTANKVLITLLPPFNASPNAAIQ